MGIKKGIILDEIKKVAKILGKDKFSRQDFFEHCSVPITQRDIESEFGSFGAAMVAGELKPAKWRELSNEELFKAYDDAYKNLGHYPLGHPGVDELSNITNISGHTFRHRFGGLKNFLFEYKNWLLETKPVTRQTVVPHKEVAILKPVAPQQGDEYFENRSRYAGKAAENLVVAELLFKGFNAQILQVDEGIDVFATNVKKNELYLIQVKYTFYEKPDKSGSITITVSSLEKNRKQNVYYIFVLEREVNKRDYLVLPYPIIDQLIKNGSINVKDGSKKMSLTVSHKQEDSAFIGSTDVSRYLNAWDVLL